MNIGIDLDNTLIYNNIINVTAKDLGYKISELFLRDWDLSNFPKKLKDEIYKRFTIPYYMCDISVPIEGNLEKLQEWNKKGHKLVIITARVPEIRVETIKMVDEFYPNIFQSVQFVNIGKSKKQAFKTNKLDIWIDDSPIETKTALDLDIKTYLISNKFTPYNFAAKKYDKIEVKKCISKIIL